MQPHPPTPAPPTVDSGAGDPRLGRLQAVIERASHLLPAQGPITVFIHHNTLHAFEDLPFHEGVQAGAKVFGCHPYLTEDRYRDELRRGRIRFADLREVLEQDLGADAGSEVPCFGTRLDLRLAMLQYALQDGPTEELVWYVAEADALRRVREDVSSAVRGRLIAETRRWVLRDLRGWNEPAADGAAGFGGPGVSAGLAELMDRFGESTVERWGEDDWERFTLQALWRVCCDGVHGLPPSTPAPAVRHRDALFEAVGADPDTPVQDLLIRFCSAFLDQGMAPWPLPGREGGLYRSFCALYRQPGGSPARWSRGLDGVLAALADRGVGPLESVLESLALLGVPEGEWEAFIASTLLALRGWGGMVRQIELRGDRAVRPVPAGSLAELLAVRLLLDRHSLAASARESLGYDGPLSGLREAARARVSADRSPGVEQRAFPVFQLAQLQGLSPDVLYRLGRPEWERLAREVGQFSSMERRRAFHMAYERRLRTQTLDAVAVHARRPSGRPPAPRFQAVFCLDEREESFRRHLEELAPDVETFGVAGFYGVAMYYRGAADAHFTPLCPVVVMPRQWVVEEVGVELGKTAMTRARRRRALGRASLRFHLGSRSFAVGALLTGAVGVLASFPLVGRILFPRLTARIRLAVSRFIQAPPRTRLALERGESAAGPEPGRVGYTVAEMIGLTERVLREIGLTTGFARLVILHGHGSNSQNNPHNSAYHCGACGGAAGGPNARALAQMLNDPRVREGLAGRGLRVPAETAFVGAYHNTCNDSVVYHDLDLLPATHRDEFNEARALTVAVSDRNAHERCRRFMSAPLTLSFAAAREHVEARSEDLAQTRPELGHATNAITAVGRREWSRGLFLDRRAFLVSYDPTGDDAQALTLERVLQAVFPVCAGINLEYYFSHVDNRVFGSGTKLPHNLAALVGVMDGAASDLRTGLPWQMVEIHEPVRSLFLIETTAGQMTQVMDRNPSISRLCRNGWVQLALLDPETRAVSVFQGGEFQPYRPQSEVIPQAASSVDWYRGWRDHLDFAEIGRPANAPA